MDGAGEMSSNFLKYSLVEDFDRRTMWSSGFTLIEGTSTRVPFKVK